MNSGILLAAGLSSRFGSQKLLIPLSDGRTLFDRSIYVHLNVPVRPLVVVISPGLFEAILEDKASTVKYRIEQKPPVDWRYLKTPWGKVRLVLNETPETGMADSLRLGLAALTKEEREEGIVISLADMPKLTSEIIQRLLSTYRQVKEKIVVPTYQGKIGHPVIIDEPVFREEILKIKGDEGLRGILKAHWEDIALISWKMMPLLLILIRLQI